MIAMYLPPPPPKSRFICTLASLPYHVVEMICQLASVASIVDTNTGRLEQGRRQKGVSKPVSGDLVSTRKGHPSRTAQSLSEFAPSALGPYSQRSLRAHSPSPGWRCGHPPSPAVSRPLSACWEEGVELDPCYPLAKRDRTVCASNGGRARRIVSLYFPVEVLCT